MSGTTASPAPTRGGRYFLKFNAVGAVGIAVQALVLELLVAGAGIHYLAAAVIASEITLLHNFLWHRKWTWADRVRGGETRSMLLRYNLSTGLVSAAGNLVLMRLLVGGLGLRVWIANLITIAACGLLCYLCADRYAFRPDPA